MGYFRSRGLSLSHDTWTVGWIKQQDFEGRQTFNNLQYFETSNWDKYLAEVWGLYVKKSQQTANLQESVGACKICLKPILQSCYQIIWWKLENRTKKEKLLTGEQLSKTTSLLKFKAAARNFDLVLILAPPVDTSGMTTTASYDKDIDLVSVCTMLANM